MTTPKRGEFPPRSGPASATPGFFFGRAVVPLVLLFVAALPVAAPLGAQDAGPTPGFVLLGDVAQKLTESAPGWTEPAAFSWAWTADLKPKFSYGAFSFVADTAWSLPLTGSLASAAPTVTVYEAYFRATPVDGLDVTFGQKRFNLGVGQTFTVGDTLNPTVGFLDQKTGFRGATAEWSPVSWFSASAAVSTDGSNPRAPAHAEQLAVLADKLQATVSLSGEADRSLTPAVGASYDLLGVIVTAEGAADFVPRGRADAPAWSASAGARYTLSLFDVDFTLAAEYLHWALAGTRGLRGEENGFLRFTVASGTALTLATFAAVDLADRSVLAQQTVTWAPWDDVEIAGALKAAQGDPGTAWADLGAANAKARYQTSFSVMYHF